LQQAEPTWPRRDRRWRARGSSSRTRRSSPRGTDTSPRSPRTRGQILAAEQSFAQFVPDHAYVVANFKETQIGGMKPGQSATIDIDALPGRELHGRVDSLAAGTGASFSLLPPDNATGNFVKVVQRVPVRITLVDAPPDLALRPGLSASVTVDVRKTP